MLIQNCSLFPFRCWHAHSNSGMGPLHRPYGCFQSVYNFECDYVGMGRSMPGSPWCPSRFRPTILAPLSEVELFLPKPDYSIKKKFQTDPRVEPPFSQ